MKYSITTHKGYILISNLDSSELVIASECSVSSELVKDSITGNLYRHGKISNEKCIIYLKTSDPKVVGKIFKKYQEIFSFYSDLYFSLYSQISENELKNTRRLKHNLVTYNSHILQEIYQLVPQDKIISRDGRSQVSKIQDALIQNPEKSSQSFLRILKNASLEKAEFDVFDKLYKTDPKLSLYEHSVHKIILLTLNSFWLDFLEREIDVEIQATNKTLMLDYNSFSVALGHIFDNATRYVLHNSKIQIQFYENVMNGQFEIKIDMTSLKVEKFEKEKIFFEGFSGSHSQQKECCGTGVGLYIARRMIELNNGVITFIPDTNHRERISFKGYNYERNRIIIEFPDKEIP